MLIAILCPNQAQLENVIHRLSQQYPFRPLQVVATVNRSKGITQCIKGEANFTPYPVDILQEGSDAWKKAICVASEMVSRIMAKRLDMPTEQIPVNLATQLDMLEAWAPHIYSGWQRIMVRPDPSEAKKLTFASKLLEQALYSDDPSRFPFAKVKFVHRYPCVDEMGAEPLGADAVICFVNVTTQELREENRTRPERKFNRFEDYSNKDRTQGHHKPFRYREKNHRNGKKRNKMRYYDDFNSRYYND
jgi:hypothetical protein